MKYLLAIAVVLCLTASADARLFCRHFCHRNECHQPTEKPSETTKRKSVAKALDDLRDKYECKHCHKK